GSTGQSCSATVEVVCANGIDHDLYPSCSCPAGTSWNGTQCVDQPPSRPVVSHDPNCTVGQPYHVSIVSTEPEGQNVWYRSRWGTSDPPFSDTWTMFASPYSNWSPISYPPGTPFSDSYTFTSAGYYEYRA